MPGTIDDTIGNGGGVTFTAFQSEIVNTFQNFYLSDSDGFNNFINYDWQNSQYPADPSHPDETGRPTFGGWWDDFMDDLEQWGGDVFAQGEDLNNDGEVDFRDAAIAMQEASDEAAQEVDDGGGLYPLFGQIAGGNFGIIFGTMADFFDWANGQ